MSEENLADLLERAADRHSVGEPPLEQMLTRGRRARKRRGSLAVVAASVVVGSLITATTLLFDRSDKPETKPLNRPPATKVVLNGEWRVVALTDGRGKSLLKSDRVRVRFNAEKVGGATECNDFFFSGRYRQSGTRGENLMVPNLNHAGSTLVGCAESPIMDSLATVRHATESDGVLRLQDQHGTSIITLVRVGERVDLEGEWKVTSLTDTAGRSALTVGLAERARVSFHNGRVDGNDECNLFEGSYESSGDDGQNLTMSRLHGSEVGCRDDLTRGLRRVRHVFQSTNSLYLQDEDWTTLASLQRLGAPSPTTTRHEPCDGDSIKVVSKVGAAVGSKGLRLTLTRTSGKPCLLPIYPQKVRFSYRDALLNLPTTLEPGNPDGSVLLAPGFPATAVLLWGNWCAAEVRNDRVEFRVGTHRFEVAGFGTSPNCGENGGAPGGASLNIKSPINIGYYSGGAELVGTSAGPGPR